MRKSPRLRTTRPPGPLCIIRPPKRGGGSRRSMGEPEPLCSRPACGSSRGHACGGGGGRVHDRCARTAQIYVCITTRVKGEQQPASRFQPRVYYTIYAAASAASAVSLKRELTSRGDLWPGPLSSAEVKVVARRIGSTGRPHYRKHSPVHTRIIGDGRMRTAGWVMLACLRAAHTRNPLWAALLRGCGKAHYACTFRRSLGFFPGPDADLLRIGF